MATTAIKAPACAATKQPVLQSAVREIFFCSAGAGSAPLSVCSSALGISVTTRICGAPHCEQNGALSAMVALQRWQKWLTIRNYRSGSSNAKWAVGATHRFHRVWASQ